MIEKNDGKAELKKIIDAKNNIKRAIESKGVNMDGVVFTSYADKINGLITGKSIFDIFYSLSSDAPPGAMSLSLGTIIPSCDENFPEFWNECIEKKKAMKIRTLSNEDWEIEVKNNGQCGAFVIDEIDRSVRLPKITSYIKIGDINNVGEYIDNKMSIVDNNNKLFDSINACLYIQIYNIAVPASTAQARSFINMVEKLENIHKNDIDNINFLIKKIQNSTNTNSNANTLLNYSGIDEPLSDKISFSNLPQDLEVVNNIIKYKSFKIRHDDLQPNIWTSYNQNIIVVIQGRIKENIDKQLGKVSIISKNLLYSSMANGLPNENIIISQYIPSGEMFYVDVNDINISNIEDYKIEYYTRY